MTAVHPVCAFLRELREAAGLSLVKAEEKYGIDAAVLGSYEAGRRKPKVDKLDEVLNFYGYMLVAAPIPADRSPRLRSRGDIVGELRAIADQLESSGS